MGRPIHFEYASTDPAKDVEFMKAVFGWEVSRWGDQPYWLVDTGKEGPGIDGAIQPENAPQQPRLVNTIEVADLDASIATAIAAGGTLALPRMEIPGIGSVAYVLSPTGIMFGMLQPLPPEERVM